MNGGIDYDYRSSLMYDRATTTRDHPHTRTKRHNSIGQSARRTQQVQIRLKDAWVQADLYLPSAQTVNGITRARISREFSLLSKACGNRGNEPSQRWRDRKRRAKGVEPST